MKKWNPILGILLLITFTSCQEQPNTHKLITNEPKESELIGKYTFKSQSIDSSIEYFENENGEVVKPTIIIKSNNEFEIKNIPYFKGFPPKYSGLISEKGKWQKDVLGAIDVGEKENLEHWGIHFIEMRKELKGAGLMNKKDPYDLVFTFGDPDQGEVMIFKKE
ncbi:hypothetical protein [Aureivirga sp. CE67]|uniref:hypothetical protein n=1 Tax=Aureivirga sp. CE67 TaxID=1788983 RepID=UPI0018C9CA74|nr:hypothetical protein [Aureivirga sp. CE67]